jgi:hypothetical protein
MLPNLLVIGAGKAGTTSLHYYLDQHPDVFMSDPKEPNLFQRDAWRERLAWYESLFPEPAAIRGEASTGYTAHPVMKDVPRRIHEVIPDTKLIYLVRDPVDRIVAHYAQHHTNGKETRPIDEALRSALRNGDDPVNPYLCTSMYATQVEQYLPVFPAERMLVVDSDDMLRDRRTVLKEVFRFVGVDDSFDTPRFDEVLNPKADQVRFSSAGERVRASRFVRFARARMPRRFMRPISRPFRRLLSEPVERPALAPELADELRSALAPEVERLRALTGKSFAGWSV